MRDNGYFNIYGWMLKEGRSATETLVLAYIASNCGWHKGICERSLLQIAEDLKISQRTVQRAIKSLSEEGLIEGVTNGGGKGNKMRLALVKRGHFDYLSTPKVDNLSTNGGQNDYVCDSKGGQIDHVSPYNNKKEYIYNKSERENARAREEELSTFIRNYKLASIDPNGFNVEHTEEETQKYQSALEERKEIRRLLADADWADILEQYPALKEWNETGTGEHYAELLEKYGMEEVMETIQYTANRKDLHTMYIDPLGYIERNLKNRLKNG